MLKVRAKTLEAHLKLLVKVFKNFSSIECHVIFCRPSTFCRYEIPKNVPFFLSSPQMRTSGGVRSRAEWPN